MPAASGRGKGDFHGNPCKSSKIFVCNDFGGGDGLHFGGCRPQAPAPPRTPNVSAITDQVHHNLAMLPWYGVFDNLEYQVNGTEVILSGQVISEHATTKDDAGKFVKSIPGVTKVVNNIEVLPPSPFDNQIRRAEYRTVFSHGGPGPVHDGRHPASPYHREKWPRVSRRRGHESDGQEHGGDLSRTQFPASSRWKITCESARSASLSLHPVGPDCSGLTHFVAPKRRGLVVRLQPVAQSSSWQPN